MTYDLNNKKELQKAKKKIEQLSALSKNRFYKYIGKIKSFNEIDSLEFQKKMRNEW
jgi:hypothetical protein